MRLCGKLEVLDRALVKLRAGGHRVLLFCTMTRLLDVLEVSGGAGEALWGGGASFVGAWEQLL